MLVLDTVGLLYWTLTPDLLTAKARRLIADADSLIISSISVWEIAVKAKRGRIVLPFSIDDYVARLTRLEKLETKPVNTETWLMSVALDWEHRDPADRVIVATAMLLNCDLITSDRVIADFFPQAQW